MSRTSNGLVIPHSSRREDRLETLNFGEWAIMSALNAPEGDFRDWDEIRDRALTIAGELKTRV